MIPKIIHYCWFGHKPLPKSAKRCIESWKKYFPDYEIKEWNEGNFDIEAIPYTAEAYKAKRYAFVSDYARFKILYEEGGVYFDTDVEVIRPMNDILAKGAFMGIESIDIHEDGTTSINVAPGLGLATPPRHVFIKELLDAYATYHFIDSQGNLNLTTIVQFTSIKLTEKGLIQKNEIQQCEGFTIYPTDYFNPKGTVNGNIRLSSNTRSIHHYDNSWHTPYEKFVMFMALEFSTFTSILVKIKHFIQSLK